MSMKKRTAFALALVAALAAAAVVAILVLGGKGGGAADPMAGLSQAERTLVQSLGPDQRKAVLEAYAAAKAQGRKARMADFMPEAVYSVQEGRAERRTLRSYLDLSGDVVTRRSVVAYPDIGGRVASVAAKLGAFVPEGGLIAQVDPSSPGSSYALSAVRAPIAGTVTSLAVQVGTRVTTASAVATVGVLDELEVDVLVRERDVALVRAGQRAVLRFEAFPGESFEAQVAGLSPVLDPVSRTRTATLSFASPDRRVQPGMYARVRIYTEALSGVVALPEAAIFERFGERYVYVIAAKEGADRVELRKIEKGVVVDGVAEAKSGLAAGERVVTAGRTALSDGALVRVVSGRGAARNGSPAPGQGSPAPGASGGAPASGTAPASGSPPGGGK